MFVVSVYLREYRAKANHEEREREGEGQREREGEGQRERVKGPRAHTSKRRIPPLPSPSFKIRNRISIESHTEAVRKVYQKQNAVLKIDHRD
jgi:hypothetical protein